MHPVRAAAAIVLLTWVPMLFLAVAQGVAVGDRITIPFLRDLDVAAKFLVAVPIMLLAHPFAMGRFADTEREFERAELVPTDVLAAYRAVEADVNARLHSRGAAVALLAIAYLAAVPGALVTAPAASNWRVLGESGRGVSLAGWWYLLVAAPLFRFMLFRWLWRYGVWARYLAQVARFPLRVVATHPDHAGGLAFVGRTQLAFSTVVIAGGAVLAADVARLIMYEGASFDRVMLVVAALVVLGALLPVGPLTFFAPLLLRARQHAFLEHGALVSRHDLAFDAKWLGNRKDPNESILGHPDASSLADISSGFEHVLQMWTVPIDRVTLFRFLLAAALPFLPLAFLKLSLAELGERLLKLVF